MFSSPSTKEEQVIFLAIMFLSRPHLGAGDGAARPKSVLEFVLGIRFGGLEELQANT